MKCSGRRVPLSSGQVGHHRLLQGTRERNLSSLLCPHHTRQCFLLPLCGARICPIPWTHPGSGNSKVMFGPPTLGLMTPQTSGGDTQAWLPPWANTQS